MVLRVGGERFCLALPKELVERKSRYTLIARMKDCGAQAALDGFTKAFAKVPKATLDGLMRNTIDPVVQPEEGVTYAHKLGKEEGVLDWRRPAAELERKVRAFHPWPGTSFELNGERIKVLAAGLALAGGTPGTLTIGRDGFPVVACGIGGLKLLQLQRPGRSAPVAETKLIAPPSVLRPNRVPCGPRSTSTRSISPLSSIAPLVRPR